MHPPRTPTLPRPVHNPAREAFRFDRLCPRCEYNLKGLSAGMNCPECGALIVTPAAASAREDNLTAAPRPYLQVLAWAMGSMSAASIIGAILFAQRRPQTIGPVIITGALVALAWCIGVILITRPRPHAITRAVTPRMEQRHLRWVVRLSQLGWFAAVGSLALSIMIDNQAMLAAANAGQAFVRPETSKLLMVGAWSSTGIAILGMLFLCYMLADMADWAADGQLAERFRMAGIGITFGAPIALLAWAFHPLLGPASFIAIVIGGIAGIGLVAGAGVMLLGLAQMAYLSHWAIKNHDNYGEVLERKGLRERAYTKDMVDRLDPTPLDDPTESPKITLDDSPAVPPPDHYAPMVIAASEHMIAKPDNVKPYELSDDAPAA
ncbi:MAG: hypothetical protein IT435_11560 [Phycisphaerales bacterium]|nr:hypothetical protein [Phycisphaerales bacterium]